MAMKSLVDDRGRAQPPGGEGGGAPGQAGTRPRTAHARARSVKLPAGEPRSASAPRGARPVRQAPTTCSTRRRDRCRRGTGSSRRRSRRTRTPRRSARRRRRRARHCATAASMSSRSPKRVAEPLDGCRAIERRRRIPERAQHRHLVDVPGAGGNDTAGSHDPRHLREAGGRITDEREHELRERGVERRVGPWQRFGRRLSHVDVGQALRVRGDEHRRRVGGRDRRPPDQADECPPERTRTASDVDDPLPGGHPQRTQRSESRADGSTRP